jgi:hypothetical protein
MAGVRVSAPTSSPGRAAGETPSSSWRPRRRLNVRSCKARDAWKQVGHEATAASCRVGLVAAEFESATEHGRKLHFDGAVDAVPAAPGALGGE